MSTGLYPSLPERMGRGGFVPNFARNDGEPSAAAVGLVVALVVLAYQLSLIRLFALMSSDTPLAYVGLVPPVVLAASLIKGKRRPGELRLPDRQVDWIIGLPLLGVATASAVLMPHRLSYQFWTNRLDLLGLPFFVAGAITLLLGSRVLYRVRWPVAALILAWPHPYEVALSRVLPGTTSLSTGALRAALPALGSAHAIGGQLFSIGQGPRRFIVNVAPACAGANGAVGFLLVAGVALLVMNGRRSAKVAWILFGIALMLGLNVVRLLLLFWVGGRYGQVAALKWLHPYVGLALFAAGMAILIGLLPPFGIAAWRPADIEGPNDGSGAGHRRRRTLTGTAIVVVAATGLLLGGQNRRLVRYDAFLAGSAARGGPPLSGAPPSVPGWSVTRYDEVTWAKPYFGQTSSWIRYAYTTASVFPARSNQTVFVDVVSTTDLGSFSRYGLEACYLFHQYRVVSSGRVGLANGVDGQTVTYRVPHGQQWSVVSWVAPVEVGNEKRFERITMLSPTAGSGSNQISEADAMNAQRQLESFARHFVARPPATAALGSGRSH